MSKPDRVVHACVMGKQLRLIGPMDLLQYPENNKGPSVGDCIVRAGKISGDFQMLEYAYDYAVFEYIGSGRPPFERFVEGVEAHVQQHFPRFEFLIIR